MKSLSPGIKTRSKINYLSDFFYKLNFTVKQNVFIYCYKNNLLL